MKNKTKRTRVINSTIKTKTRLLISFPKYNKLLSTGVRSSPKIEFPSFSIAKERPSPRIPANVKVTQRIAGVANFKYSEEKLKAKLKIRRIISEKVNIADSNSFVLNSVTMSFHKIVKIFRII